MGHSSPVHYSLNNELHACKFAYTDKNVFVVILQKKNNVIYMKKLVQACIKKTK